MTNDVTNDIPLARREVIAARLAGGQAVVAAALAAEFSVSEDAIRRDLRALAEQGLCRRVYGGALPVVPQSPPMAARVDAARARKRALARRAAARVRRGELIFIDNGSTNLALAEVLPEDFDLTVATNCVDVAAALLRRGDVRLLLIGGLVDAVVGGCVDAAAVQAVARLRIDRCFVGACALAVGDGGASFEAFDHADASFKRQLLAVSRERVVMLTNEKLGTTAPYRIAALDEAFAPDCVVVEHDAPREPVEALLRAAVPVERADPPGDEMA
jgi:DeoR/GlpR family transcriptional regulator of sugar metabolism